MFYINNIDRQNNLYSVVDTKDGVSEWYSKSDLLNIIQNTGITIKGVGRKHFYKVRKTTSDYLYCPDILSNEHTDEFFLYSDNDISQLSEQDNLRVFIIKRDNNTDMLKRGNFNIYFFYACTDSLSNGCIPENCFDLTIHNLFSYNSDSRTLHLKALRKFAVQPSTLSYYAYANDCTAVINVNGKYAIRPLRQSALMDDFAFVFKSTQTKDGIYLVMHTFSMLSTPNPESKVLRVSLEDIFQSTTPFKNDNSYRVLNNHIVIVNLTYFGDCIRVVYPDTVMEYYRDEYFEAYSIATSQDSIKAMAKAKLFKKDFREPILTEGGDLVKAGVSDDKITLIIPEGVKRLRGHSLEFEQSDTDVINRIKKAFHNQYSGEEIIPAFSIHIPQSVEKIDDNAIKLTTNTYYDYYFLSSDCAKPKLLLKVMEDICPVNSRSDFISDTNIIIKRRENQDQMGYLSLICAFIWKYSKEYYSTNTILRLDTGLVTSTDLDTSNQILRRIDDLDTKSLLVLFKLICVYCLNNYRLYEEPIELVKSSFRSNFIDAREISWFSSISDCTVLFVTNWKKYYIPLTFLSYISNRLNATVTSLDDPVLKNLSDEVIDFSSKVNQHIGYFSTRLMQFSYVRNLGWVLDTAQYNTFKKMYSDYFYVAEVFNSLMDSKHSRYKVPLQDILQSCMRDWDETFDACRPDTDWLYDKYKAGFKHRKGFKEEN